MIPNYLLTFKLQGSPSFTLTCDDPEEIPILQKEYCVEAGDCCAIESPRDKKPAIAIATRTADGNFFVECSFEPAIIEQIKNDLFGV